MINKRLSLLVTLLLWSGLIAIGQNFNPGPGKIFNEDEIATVSITMDQADKEWMLAEENIWSETYLPATFSFTNSEIDTTLAFEVGIRLRGNTSREKPKKSFKIKFKEFGGEKFFDLKKFNLKAEVNDPSMVRELLTLRAFRDFNVPAARSHHVEVYINNEYMGIYINVEQIDDEFVQERFDYDEGNLYKCYWGANLQDDGQIYDDGIYELEINSEINDRSTLANFVDVLNNTPSSSFIAEIEAVFNVDRYIRYLAVEALTGHWDGYSYNQNNFYLYENDDTGLVEFIVYDVDNTFGIDWIGRDWGTRDVLDWVKHGDPRPLSSKILAQTTYYERYRRYLDELLNTKFSLTYYNSVFDAYEVLLSTSVESDTYYPESFGYSVADFYNSFDAEVTSHAPYGLKPYIETRASFARNQVGVVTAIEADHAAEFSVYPNPVSQGRIFIRVNNGQLTNIRIFDAQGRVLEYQQKQLSNDLLEITFSPLRGLYTIQSDAGTRKILVK